MILNIFKMSTNDIVSILHLDADECQSSGICLNGRCVNTRGSFNCICKPGYTLSSDKTYCSGISHLKFIAFYVLSSDFLLIFTKRYIPKSSETDAVVISISDMNECEQSKMCPNGRCINMDGSYKCVCKPGYKRSPNQQICYGEFIFIILHSILKIKNFIKFEALMVLNCALTIFIRLTIMYDIQT